MNLALIYTRFSPKPMGQEKTTRSCEWQEERAREYCAKKRYKVFGVYEDKAVTGKTDNRAGFKGALADMNVLARSGQTVVFVVDCVDRLLRDVAVGAVMRAQIEATGATLEFVDGTPVEDTPESRLMLNVLSAFAQFERDRISYRVSRAFKRRQSEGEYFGKPPVGYMLEGGGGTRLIKNEQEQAGIKEITRLGRLRPMMTSEQIADAVTKDVGLFRGRSWSARTVRRIIAEQGVRRMLQMP
jgi:DNA invertase Pin-like site-specific DNA recombinase